MPATTVDRVAQNTPDDINRAIRERMLERVLELAEEPQGISRRLRELDAEWDIERALEANAAMVSLFGFAMSKAHSKRWLVLPAVVSAFLFQHAVEGWCPPLPMLRRCGFRTAREIEIERNALKRLRGDYGPLPTVDPRAQARDAIAGAERGV